MSPSTPDTTACVIIPYQQYRYRTVILHQILHCIYIIPYGILSFCYDSCNYAISDLQKSCNALSLACINI